MRAALIDLNDAPAALQQAELINGLLPKVTDEQLSVPRDEIRIALPETRLWAADDQLTQEQATKDLEGLYAEFMERKPRAEGFAASCRFYQANWFGFVGKTKEAKAAIVEAHELLLHAPAPVSLGLLVAAKYVEIVGPTDPVRAEHVAGEHLGKPRYLDPEVRAEYLKLVAEMSNTLCRQDRFAEAIAMLEEQRRLLVTRGGSGTHLVRLDALRGAVLARSGNARDALPILETVATNRLSDVMDWMNAAIVANATGDHDSFQRLRRICSLRFTSTVEGNAALLVVVGLYQQPMDDDTLAMARALMDRADDGSIFIKLQINSVSAVLAYREHRYPEALVLLDRFLGAPSSRPGSRFTLMDPAQQASSRFIRAMLCAELGRTEVARRDFAQARDQLKLALGDKPGHDRGGEGPWAKPWVKSYQAESWMR